MQPLCDLLNDADTNIHIINRRHLYSVRFVLVAHWGWMFANLFEGSTDLLTVTEDKEERRGAIPLSLEKLCRSLQSQCCVMKLLTVCVRACAYVCAYVCCRFRERSHSVWPQLWKDRAEFINPLYAAEQSQCQGVLRPNTTPYCFKLVTAVNTLIQRHKVQSTLGSCCSHPTRCPEYSFDDCSCCFPLLLRLYTKRNTLSGLLFCPPSLQNVEGSLQPCAEVNASSSVTC